MNKKNKFFSGMLAAVVSAAFLIPAAHAVPYTLDFLLGSAVLGNSGDATELTEMELQASNLNLIQDLKLNQDDPLFNVTTNGTGEWFIDVAPTTPGYFLLKFGTGSFPKDTHDTFFFRNDDDFTKLVFSDVQVNNLSGGLQNTNIERLSHYTTYNGDNPPCTDCDPVTVPEPTTLLLMSAGLFGFGLARRRKSA